MKPDVRVLGGRCSRMGLRTRCFIYEASLWYPSLPVLRRELAGAVVIPIGEPFGHPLASLAGRSVSG